MDENTSSDDLIPKKLARSPSLVSDDEAFLPTSLDFENLHYGTITRLYAPENVLVDLEGVFGRLLEENGVGNSSDVGFTVKQIGTVKKAKGRREEVRTNPSVRVEEGGDLGNLHLLTK
jgi:hypothetical protein